MHQVNGDATPTVDKITALSVRWKTQSREPYASAKGQGVRVTTREIHLFGGIDLSSVSPHLISDDDGTARSIGNAVLRELHAQPTRTVFTVPSRTGPLTAVALPVLQPNGARSVRR